MPIVYTHLLAFTCVWVQCVYLGKSGIHFLGDFVGAFDLSHLSNVKYLYAQCVQIQSKNVLLLHQENSIIWQTTTTTTNAFIKVDTFSIVVYAFDCLCIVYFMSKICKYNLISNLMQYKRGAIIKMIFEI